METRGIELVPADQRRRRPRDLALLFAGVQLSFGALLTGALPLAMGLTLAHAIAAVVVGNLAGAVLVALMAPIGIATASNITVASSAVFGMRGRYLGSVITQAIDIGYVALTLVLAVPAIDEALHILFGVAPSRAVLVATMAATSLVTVGLALAGQATVMAAQKANLVAGAAIVAILVTCALRHPPLHHATPDVAPHALFVAALAVQFANALSWAPYVGDAARYVAPQRSRLHPALVVYAGMGAGALVSTGAGLLIATRVAEPGRVLAGMVDLLPRPLVAPVVLLGALGNAASGAVLIYNGMLDLQSILWRRSRVAVGVMFSAAAVLVAFAALVVFDLADSLEAMCTVVGLLLTPWLVVILADLLRRERMPDPRALRDFDRVLRDNPLWRHAGWQPRPLAAWACGAASGLLAHIYGRADTGVPLAAAVALLVSEVMRPGRRRRPAPKKATGSAPGPH